MASPRRRAVAAAGGFALLGFAFLALGFWQIERRAWKLELIARTEARLATPPVEVPARGEWPRVTRAGDEYRRVRVEGRMLDDRSVRVTAATELGAGFWLLTPVVTDAGDTILVNRGFVPPGWTASARDTGARVAVAGLLRMSEPGGAFLRANDPARGHWYSRDTEAIALAQGLGPTAPFFVDADRSGDTGGGPVGGLTAVTFRNNHLVYALTWFALALMSWGATVMFAREARAPSFRG